MSMASRAAARFQAELQRMRKEQEDSEAKLNSTMTLDAAYTTLQRKQRTRAALALLEEGLHTAEAGKAPRLRSNPLASLAELEKYNPTSSLKKARTMLGQMITEATMEYDQLQLECSMFFKKQCGLLETCREDISSANSLAAEWRGKILSAQSEINMCEVRLPRLQENLDSSIKECNMRLGFLRRDLGVVMNDISVMANVLKLTDCKGGSTFAQMEGLRIRRCKGNCSKASFDTVDHHALRGQLEMLKSSHVREAVQRGLQESASDEAVKAAAQPQGQQPQGQQPQGQQPQGQQPQGQQPPQGAAVAVPPAGAGASVTLPPATLRSMNKTEWRNEPLPQEELPDDPCSGIDYDDGRRSTGCVPRATPQCYNLANKFLNIQTETVDKRDELLEEIRLLEAACEETKLTLEGEIQMFTTKLSDEHTKLAEGTSGENTAAEEGQMKSTEHTELKKGMFTSRSTCSAKFRGLEGELCALKKIRTELFKMKGAKHPFFQDCTVGDWEETECSLTCGGGVQELHRSVIMPATGGGSACPPLKQMQSCQEQPCPVDCKLEEWSGWSACSAECGGGVMERARNVLVHPRYEGKPCGDTSETVSCNMQACDKDCDLAPWTEWSICSKQCDAGSRTKRRAVATPAVGRGKCPLKRDAARLIREPCNEQACMRDPVKPLLCKTKIDVVLLLDGSGSVGSSGWSATKAFAKKFVQAFEGPQTDAQVSVILFSGPYAWNDLKRCQDGAAGLDMKKDCKISFVQHFSSDMTQTASNIDKLSWPMGTTLTSSALSMAQSELYAGRRGAERVVLTVTDGIPLSTRSTKKAAENLRKSARLMFAAVKLSQTGLRYMMEWGSEPSAENVLKINSFKSLESIATIDALIADMCRSIDTPPVAMPTMSIR